MSNKITFDDSDNPMMDSDESDYELTEREQKLLKNIKTKKSKKKSNEVLRFSDDDEDEDNQQDIEDEEEEYSEDDSDMEKYRSDIEDNENDDDGIPNERAWGKKKGAYYQTGFVDQDFSTYNEKEEELALQEEAEAKALQMRLAKELNEMDFSLNVFMNDEEKTKEPHQMETVLKTDLSNMSIRQKIQLFKKDSPEFDGLINDLMTRMDLSQNTLEPILDYYNKNKLQDHPIFNFIITKNNLILNYATNILFYLVLKAKRISIKNHPIVNRLVQMRQLIIKLEKKYDECIKKQIEVLLEKIKNGESIGQPEKTVEKLIKPKKRLNILKDLEKSDENPKKKVKIVEPVEKIIEKDSSDEDEKNEEEQLEEDVKTIKDDEKRGITYEIAKNKGLTPHRKKENRNPRVKHRNKFKKALVRRKGAVRTVRKELSRYSGEMSGIKATVRKSIKIK